MRDAGPHALERMLVVLPNWVGDIVLATPALAALRRGFPSAEITFLLKQPLREIVEGSGWHDQEVYWPTGRGPRQLPDGWKFADGLRRRRFDLAILLTNSWRSALTAWLAGIPRRIGFARDGRGFLLTDCLRYPRREGEYVPVSVCDSYVQLARRAGCRVDDKRLRLSVSAAQHAAARELLAHHRLDPNRPYAVLNAGAAFGAAKCWPADRFAALCDRLRSELGLVPVLVGGAAERELMGRIADRAVGRPTRLIDPGTTLGSLKGVVAGASLLVCNDSGPRHYGNALGVPTVTIFGPTHQAWTRTLADREIAIQAQVPCGPCQLRTCPLDHLCMNLVSVEMVMHAVRSVLRLHSALPVLKGALSGAA